MWLTGLKVPANQQIMYTLLLREYCDTMKKIFFLSSSCTNCMHVLKLFCHLTLCIICVDVFSFFLPRKFCFHVKKTNKQTNPIKQTNTPNERKFTNWERLISLIFRIVSYNFIFTLGILSLKDFLSDNSVLTGCTCDVYIVGKKTGKL